MPARCKRFGGVDVAEAGDFRLIEQREFERLPGALKRVMERFVGELRAERFGREFPERPALLQFIASHEQHHAEVALIGEEQFLAVVEPETRVRVRFIYFIGSEVEKAPRHPQVGNQRAAHYRSASGCACRAG